jgi:signal peptidase II
MKKEIVIAVSALLIDRALKYLAVLWNGFFVVGEVFGAGFGAVQNAGVAFFPNVRHAALIPLMVAALCAAAVAAAIAANRLAQTREKRKSLLTLGCFLLCAGGASNLLDRLLYGHVVDYLSLYIPGHGFAFNGADAMIVIGAIALLFCNDGFFKRSKIADA